MKVQNIDMAVPVGRDSPDQGTDEIVFAELAEKKAGLESLAGSFLQAIRKWRKPVWTSKELPLRRQLFEVEVKGLAKRLASNIVRATGEQKGRTELQVRLYADLMCLMNRVMSDAMVHRARKRVLLQWAWTLSGGILLGSVVLNVILLWPGSFT